MCGICGVVHRDPDWPVPVDRLLAMREALTHRGPDDAGAWIGPGVGLANRRLAILDLSERGHMPMVSADGRYRITYNGEVYNYRQLRKELEATGHAFRSDTDTEVVLELYAAMGPGMLDRLNGMFAIAIWDDRDRSLFLARDRLGIKPLCWAEQDGAFLFGSEAKALFAGGLPARMDPGAWEELLLFRFVAGKQTAFEGVHRLLPGHWMRWKDGRIETRRWWHLGEQARAAAEGLPADPIAWFRDTFDDAIRLQRISDVPLGVFLSGGLDSSSVAASLAMQAGAGVESFTMGFPEKTYDEEPLAAEVARRWGLTHHGYRVADADLAGLVMRSAYLNDEPLAHGNDQHLHLVAREAKPRVTILLSGEGADETHGGYVRYRPLTQPAVLATARGLLPPLVRLMRLGGRRAKLAAFLELGSIEDFVLYNACNVLPADLAALGFFPSGELPYRRAVLDEARQYSPEPVRQAMYLDQHTFLCSLLDRNDRMTMGASIECRVPFLDHRLVAMAAALPTSLLLGPRQGKRVIRQAMGDRLPAAVLRHPKWGFGVPWNRLLREQPALRDRLLSLADTEPARSGPLDRAAVRGLARRFVEGSDAGYAMLLELLALAVWHEAAVAGAPPSPAGGAA